MNPLIAISLLATVTIVAFVWAIYSWTATRAADRASLRRRLDPNAFQKPTDPGAPDDILRDERFSDIPSLNSVLRWFSPATYLRNIIMQAGMTLSVLNTLYIMAFLTLAIALALQVRFELSRPISMLAGGTVGVLGTIGYIKHRRKKRLQTFASQLPGALDMMRSSIYAGHTLNYALEIAVEELRDPIASEFRTVLTEMRLGLSPREALEHLSVRVPVPELRFFILAVILTREVGGNLSEVLGTLAVTLRDRMKLRQQVKALSSQGRASATLLFMIPPGVAFAANLMRPGFVEPLFYHPTGRMFLGIALFLQMMGFLLVRRIVNPKELGVT